MKKIHFIVLILLIAAKGVNAQSDLNNGLVAYYPFNGNANDESGNGKNGFVYSASLTTDRFGNANKAYSFDGLSNYIITPINSGFFTQISMCAWFKTSYNDYGGIFCSRTAFNMANAITTEKYGHPSLYLTDGTTNTTTPFIGIIPYSVQLNDNIWHLIVGTYDGSKLRLYADGVLLEELSKTFIVAVNSYFKIGHDDLSGYSRYFNGKIDDVRLYNRAITEQEVQLLYNEANPTTDIPKTTENNIVMFVNHTKNAISVKGADENSVFLMLDVSGKQVSQGKLRNNQIDISNLQRGVYIVTIETGKVKSSKMIVK